MPDKIKMYYSKLRNMGDCLNELIVKECFGYEAERLFSGWGDLRDRKLSGTVYAAWFGNDASAAASTGSVAPVYVWGTGFINYRCGWEVFSG